MAKIGLIEGDLKEFWEIGFLEESFQKGWSRKHTENWVTRCRNLFWGNFTVLRCFAKRNYLEELGFGFFWSFGRCSHVEG
jgi:hypothetical protein